jgi:ketosteroid isomerase-like protein
MTRAELEDLTLRFTDAFNREDLDAVMAFVAEDAVYDQFNGARAVGKAAIRAAFVPQFRGDFGAATSARSASSPRIASSTRRPERPSSAGPACSPATA